MVLFIVGAVIAVADWAAVQQRLFRLEYLLKPLAVVLLLLAAVEADLGSPQLWVIAALGFSVIGDVALLGAKRGARADTAFLIGLGAFLFAHLAYVIAFLLVGIRGLDVLAGLLVVLGAAGLALPQVLRAIVAGDARTLMQPVLAYAVVLAAMTMLAAGTGIALVAVGGALFLASDTILARDRFVGPMRHGPLLVIVTYHLAQFLIVLGLVRSFG